ncbi:oxygen-independent coproporphyrinogen III oxidase [Candidatus Thiothrix sp. Deng01]|uniref:Coproporphyrinogen-III oxidase n=1 Tax=Candidatus Thiothrix phosphatis TaxID=3112415 RepID=A0ABU6CZQ3_9GAMM|nr:oxygen-independent coproporphyrinogen III oxidase [Candidatus Thiothrix sp. Deng01]MEB4592306.1 oxygen-independent coproporphyrinogen III oxidase [Candidatus Thiothrix sp. Deng01]
MSIVQFDAELIRRYDTAGPRYTSYPTAVAFGSFTEDEYKAHAYMSNEDPIPLPLSLYFHIPFCDTVCFYCACNKIVTKDHAKAAAYLQYLFREIEMQSKLYDRDRVVEQLHWGGGTPTFLSHDEMRALMEKTRQHFALHITDDGDYSIEIDPRSVSVETIGVLREIGFNRFSLGVQDVDAKVQDAVNRIQPIGQTVSIIDACRAQGAKSISVDLIYGLPFQTVDSFRQTLDTMIGISPDRISVFNYAHLPNLFKPQRRINEADLPSPDTKLQIMQLAVEHLTAAGYEYIGMDHFAKPDDELAQAQRQGTLHRNFQGYTTHADCDLIGMGVSSISSVAECYSQNAKTLEEYYATLDTGHLPVIKGLTLDEDDILRRYIIQQLACHFRLDFGQVERFFSLDFADYFTRELEVLQTMTEDALLQFTPTGLEVTPRGRFLIRNICMVFDVSLRKQSAQQRFSRVI